jgi:predicted O-methyltransferase YrrM
MAPELTNPHGPVTSDPSSLGLLRAAKRSALLRLERHRVGRLGRLGHPRARALGEALAALARGAGAGGALARIEAERARLLGQDVPLADGSLGPGGPFDAGVSVAEACRASKKPRSALLLHLLVRELAPRRVLELGTNLGISAAYQASALPRDGRLLSLEASPYRQRIARDLHRRLGLENVAYRCGLFADVLDAALDEIGPVELAFIDGHHERQPTLDYFARIVERAAERCVFVFDDIRPTPTMESAWREILRDPRLDLAVDLTWIGVAVRGASPGGAATPLAPLRRLLA